VGLTQDDLKAVFVLLFTVTVVIGFDLWWKKRNG